MSVTIPARPFLYIDKQDEDYLVNLIRGGIQKELGRKQ
jgi:phage gpG-like protein